MRAFQNMALVFLDFFWFARHTRQRVIKYVKMDSSVPAYFPPPPAVVVTAHFGNWELMSRAFTAHGYLHIAVVAPLANPAVDVMLNKFRAAGERLPVLCQAFKKNVKRASRLPAADCGGYALDDDCCHFIEKDYYLIIKNCRIYYRVLAGTGRYGKS